MWSAALGTPSKFKFVYGFSANQHALLQENVQSDGKRKEILREG
jgi:hypothetical protein